METYLVWLTCCTIGYLAGWLLGRDDRRHADRAEAERLRRRVWHLERLGRGDPFGFIEQREKK